MAATQRADQLLVARGLAPSRSRARELIAAGAVTVGIAGHREPLRKPASQLPEDAELAVAAQAQLRYVSRGGLKLEGALRHTGIDVRGAVCLDLGQSTGGFTDCLLQAGAARVVGIDVGHGQLHPRLRDDPRVCGFEGVNVRRLDAQRLGAAMPAEGFTLVVADLSFISLTFALPAAAALLRSGGRLLALVKPQFELGPGAVDRHGIVRDVSLYAGLRERIEAAATVSGLKPLDWFDSPIRGGDGNLEFFLYATK